MVGGATLAGDRRVAVRVRRLDPAAARRCVASPASAKLRSSSARPRSSPTSAPPHRQGRGGELLLGRVVRRPRHRSDHRRDRDRTAPASSVAFLTAAGVRRARRGDVARRCRVGSPPPRATTHDAVDGGSGAEPAPTGVTGAALGGVRPSRGARAGTRAGLRHRRVRGVLGVPARVLEGARVVRLRRAVRRVQRRLPRRCASAGPGSRSGSARATSGTDHVRACSAPPCAARRSCRRCGRCGWPPALVGVAMSFLYPSLMALTVNRATSGNGRGRSARSRCSSRSAPSPARSAFGAVADVLGKRVGFAGAVALCAAGLWVMWVKVLPTPAPSRRPERRRPRPRLRPCPRLRRLTTANPRFPQAKSSASRSISRPRIATVTPLSDFR